jgi:hypothetical protein
MRNVAGNRQEDDRLAFLDMAKDPAGLPPGDDCGWHGAELASWDYISRKPLRFRTML